MTTGKMMLVALVVINSLGLPFLIFQKTLNLKIQPDLIHPAWLAWLVVIYFLFQGKRWARVLYFGGGILAGAISLFYALGILINIRTELIPEAPNFNKVLVLIGIAAMFIAMSIFGLTSQKINAYLLRKQRPSCL